MSFAKALVTSVVLLPVFLLSGCSAEEPVISGVEPENWVSFTPPASDIAGRNFRSKFPVEPERALPRLDQDQFMSTDDSTVYSIDVTRFTNRIDLAKGEGFLRELVEQTKNPEFQIASASYSEVASRPTLDVIYSWSKFGSTVKERNILQDLGDTTTFKSVVYTLRAAKPDGEAKYYDFFRDSFQLN